MGHVTENAPRIADDLVRGVPLDVADEPDSTHDDEKTIGLEIGTLKGLEGGAFGCGGRADEIGGTREAGFGGDYMNPFFDDLPSLLKRASSSLEEIEGGRLVLCV